ncbi:hypothetical protein D0Y65_012198 [Glycine soja]|nr:hypothetical protein D0Y65_012198 [Glycine soja]
MRVYFKGPKTNLSVALTLRIEENTLRWHHCFVFNHRDQSSSPPRPDLFSTTFKVISESQIMGRKAGTLFINPKRFGNLQKPCMKEMALFLSCMAANHSDTDACARQKELLNVCIDAQSKKNRKSWGSINYQLQRLNRGRK